MMLSRSVVTQLLMLAFMAGVAQSKRVSSKRNGAKTSNEFASGVTNVSISSQKDMVNSPDAEYVCGPVSNPLNLCYSKRDSSGAEKCTDGCVPEGILGSCRCGSQQKAKGFTRKMSNFAGNVKQGFGIGNGCTNLQTLPDEPRLLWERPHMARLWSVRLNKKTLQFDFFNCSTSDCTSGEWVEQQSSKSLDDTSVMDASQLEGGQLLQLCGLKSTSNPCDTTVMAELHRCINCMGLKDNDGEKVVKNYPFVVDEEDTMTLEMCTRFLGKCKEAAQTATFDLRAINTCMKESAEAEKQAFLRELAKFSAGLRAME